MSEIPRGAIRFNTDSNKPELWDGSQWAEFQLSTPNLGTNLTPTGSVFFSGATKNRLTIPTSSDFAFGTGDFTIEMFVYHTNITGQQTYFGDTYGGDPGADGIYTYKTTNNEISLYDTAQRSLSAQDVIHLNTWHHVAWARASGTLRAFVDGIEVDSDSYSGDFTTQEYFLGDTASTSSGEFVGYMSNVRVIKGTALYTGNFTVPTAPLTNVTNTKLLCCQSTTSATAAAVSPGTLVATSATASSFGPLNSDRQPGTRGLFGGGQLNYTNGISNIIDYVNISSQGNALDFGDLSSARRWCFGAVASRTRGVWAGGLDPAINDTIDFVTIASTGNATDFGNQVDSKATYGAVCNETRGVFGGGNPAASSSKTAGIDYITIASTGDSVNFGNLETATASLCATAGQVRGLFFGGYTPTVLRTIQFVTTSTLGDAQDFGDLARTNGQEGQACSNAIRGICSGGTGPAACTDIEYVNISTLGNGQKFGDLTSVSVSTMGAVSSPTRGVISVDDTNKLNLDMIEIMTEGNALDFGDLSVARDIGSGCSNAHGGL